LVKQLDRYWVFVRYFSVSIFVYLFILTSMYLLVNELRIDKTVSYVIVYLLAYLAEYSMTLNLVFRSDHHWLKVIKFILNTAMFLALGTAIFHFMIIATINYLIATIAVAAILLPFRFISNKYFVYR
jgi:putative flippase GtrA